MYVNNAVSFFVNTRTLSLGGEGLIKVIKHSGSEEWDIECKNDEEVITELLKNWVLSELLKYYCISAVTFENATIVYLNTPIRVRVCAKRIDCWISTYQFTRTEEGGRATLRNSLRRGMVLESAQLVHFLSTAFVCFPHGWKLFSNGLCKWQDISTRYQLLKTQGSYDSHLRSSVAVLKRWK